jgi:prepilin-type N-terminal cleavage/methylation domain-containing protein
MTAPARRGYTLLELVVVLALLLILAAAVIPTIPGLWGNTRQKAAADAVRARLADARSKAMEDNKPYRVAVSSDGTRIRMAPEGQDFAQLPADTPPELLSQVSETRLEKVTVDVVSDEGDVAPTADQGGWLTIATFLSDGTAREDNVIVAVRERDFPPIQIRVRGVTGSVRVLRTQPNSGSPGAMPNGGARQ